MWGQLLRLPQTQGLSNYLAAKFSVTDRRYLLLEALTHFRDNYRATLAANGHHEEPPKSGFLEQRLRPILEAFAALNLEPATFAAVLDQGRTSSDRRRLHEDAGVDLGLVNLLVKSADLQRVTEIDFPLSCLLIEAGVDSVPELRMRNVANLTERLQTVIEAGKYEIAIPVLETVQAWIAEARDLPGAIEY